MQPSQEDAVETMGGATEIKARCIRPDLPNVDLASLYQPFDYQ
jgi:hypothetical protein